jgi:hypothetical protein
MRNKKTIGIALLLVGIILLTLSLTADWTGLGAAANAFGYKQIIGAVVGLLAGIAGLFLILKK